MGARGQPVVNRLAMLQSRLGSAATFARNQARATALRRSLEVHMRDDLVTVGQFPTAGYRIPVGLLDPGSVVYSVGVGDNISFDLELIARVGCTVHGIDPVPRAAEYARAAAAHEPRFVLHRLAVWSRDETLTFHAPRKAGYVSHSAVNLYDTAEAFQAEGRSLRSLMHQWGHDRIDLLKISAEGAEFEILEALLRDGPIVPILCAEFTLPPLSRAHGMLDQLAAAGYVLTSEGIERGTWTFTWLHTASRPLR